MNCANIIVQFPVLPQDLGTQITMVEFGGSHVEEDGVDHQTNIPSTTDSYLNLQTILSQQLQSQKKSKEPDTDADVFKQIREIKTQFSMQLNNIHSAVERVAVQQHD